MCTKVETPPVEEKMNKQTLIIKVHLILYYDCSTDRYRFSGIPQF